jgi:thymidylate synthase
MSFSPEELPMEVVTVDVGLDTPQPPSSSPIPIPSDNISYQISWPLEGRVDILKGKDNFDCVVKRVKKTGVSTPISVAHHQIPPQVVVNDNYQANTNEVDFKSISKLRKQAAESAELGSMMFLGGSVSPQKKSSCWKKNKSPEIAFYRTSQKAKIPCRGSKLSAGMDVFAPQAGTICQFRVTKIPLNLKVVIPSGHYLRIANRSSFAARGVDILGGVIDEDYRGEISCVFVNHSSENVNFKAGDAIAQLILEKISRPRITEALDDVQDTHPTARGKGGFGSTNSKTEIPLVKPIIKKDFLAAPRFFSVIQDASNSRWEDQYWTMVNTIIMSGELKSDTNHGGSRSLFKPLDFAIDVMDGLNYPLLTGRYIPFNLVAKELLWFLSGSCDSKDLEVQKCFIWKGNTSREYLDSRGLQHYDVGETGPMYGFQWRHFGAKYEGKNHSYFDCGVDQVDGLIKRLKTKPNDRGHVITAYNPSQKHEQCITPCHVYMQFYVSHDGGQLNLSVIQRSVDVALGLPFNIASYSLFLIMVARVVNMKAGMYYHTCMDTHIYNEHLESMVKYCDRYFFAEYPIYPSIFVPFKKSVDDYVISDFKVENYQPMKNIENAIMKMTV